MKGSLRVGASVGHGQQVGLAVLLLEVLVGELLAVDGLATGALSRCQLKCLLLCVTRLFFEVKEGVDGTDVTTGEVTALKHEIRNDAVERGALVPEALLAGAESAEVLSSLGDDRVVELEVDAAALDCIALRRR